MDPGNLRTHIHVGVGGAHGTTARARRGRAGELFKIFGFWERERQRYTSIKKESSPREHRRGPFFRDPRDTIFNFSRTESEGAHGTYG